MHHNIDYRGDNSPRRAIGDLFRWYGLAKSKLIARTAKQVAAITDTELRNRNYSALAFSLEMSGVSGHPVRELFRHYGGSEQLQSWLNS